jgi:hypothetical protein
VVEIVSFHDFLVTPMSKLYRVAALVLQKRNLRIILLNLTSAHEVQADLFTVEVD